MEFVILGLLLIRRLTQYEIKNALKQKVSPFFSASLGSIQAALRKLESEQHVQFEEVIDNGRNKKVYSITVPGTEHWRNWMLSPPSPNRFEQDATTRLFFLGFLAKHEQLAVLSQIIRLLNAAVREFEDAEAEAQGKEIPSSLKQVVRFQLLTLDFGLHAHRSALEWFTRLYAEMEESDHEHG
ncbi:helix-turn-helix transcriptional regulator [Paenibacillus kobensis]|uniref:helix-turn-helix transcriptional regulator n=1 Tax=Paenibacillus kobensis TaxID=59841 RepID=UPI0013E378D8|nr:helix-turn-helix transcriptional regulator [Paenibacillus kobensis]